MKQIRFTGMGIIYLLILLAPILTVSAQDDEISREQFLSVVADGRAWEVIQLTEYNDTNPNGVSLSNIEILKMRKDYFTITFQSDGKLVIDPEIKGIIFETVNGNAWKYSEEGNYIEILEDDEARGKVEVVKLLPDYFSIKVTSERFKDSSKVYMMARVGRHDE